MKTGYISIIGKPNVGKSTLINNLVNKRVSIITNKPQTTRNKIYGTFLDDEAQIVFIDTPGLHKAKNKLDLFLNSEVKHALKKSDLAFFITDPTRDFDEEDFEITHHIESFHIETVFCIISKTDIATPEEISDREAFIKKQFPHFQIVKIASINKEQVLELINLAKPYLEDVSDEMLEDIESLEYSDLFLVNEIIREKILLNFKQEIPYSIAVVTESINYNQEQNMTRIYANIIVEKESQKPIVIGKQGSMIKKIGTLARKELLEIFDSKIYLELNVKVKKNWRNNNDFIIDFGYKK
ncbi:MAG: GTPase Era [Mycoplasmoidaceae bacterium]